MRSIHLYAALAAFSMSVAAWDEIFDMGSLVQRGAEILEIRQATTTTSKFDLSATNQEGQITTSSTVKATTKSSGSNTASITGSASDGGNSNNTSATPTTTSYTQTVFDPQDPPGGISMITPNPFSGATYYKIKDYVTFGWNYTGCSILPTGIDILAVASASDVRHTYTVALNQSVSGTSQAFTWDTGKYQSTATDPLLTASYTLVVYDAAKDVTASASPGYLAAFSGFYFAMYTPQPSVAFDGFQCVTCNAAMSMAEKQALGVVFGMCALTVLSFTWFAGAAGVL